MADNGMERLSQVERLAIAEEKVRAAHQRMDKFEVDVKEDLHDLLEIIREVQADTKTILAHYNQSIGAKAVIISLAAALGGAVVWAVEHFFIK